MILHLVSVLVFVDEVEYRPLLHLIEGVRMFGEQLYGASQNVVKVDRVGTAQAHLVAAVRLDDQVDGQPRDHAAPEAFALEIQGLRRPHVRLGAVD